MPLLKINAGPSGPRLHGTGRALRPVLEKALRGGGPIVIMLHGYKFEPGHASGCPHGHILSLSPYRDCWKAISWPRALGYGTGRADEGLAIAFAWPARGSLWRACRQADQSSRSLADLICMLNECAPDRPVHILAHSLGARLALRAMQHTPANSIGRIILLHGADFGSNACAALTSPACARSELINITSRENDFFDFLYERLVAPPESGDRTLSHAMPRRPNTLTVQLDDPDTLTALAAQGFAIAPPAGKICHWSAYLRPGVFDLYRTLLRGDPAISLDQLRAILPDQTAPRWSRILTWPGPRLPLPFGRSALP